MDTYIVTITIALEARDSATAEATASRALGDAAEAFHNRRDRPFVTLDVGRAVKAKPIRAEEAK